jgi:hypothetical protein
MVTDAQKHRSVLQSIARRTMLERGHLPDFAPAALAELAKIRSPEVSLAEPTRELRNLSWCFIDNEDSRNLDQLTVAAANEAGAIRFEDMPPLNASGLGHRQLF